jgi:hypothetical protein
MSITLSLPPSARDFQIYQRLTLEGASTRQAAADFSLSQTRIRQIVERVTHWLAETLPKPTETEDAAYLRLAQHIAADRLQFLYSEAMHGWRATHQAKYAGVIFRITAAHAKMPVSPGTLDALVADALEGPLPDDFSWRVGPACEASDGPPAREDEAPAEPPTARPSTFDLRPSAPPSPPPPRDCSTSAQKPPADIALPAARSTTTSAAATTSAGRNGDRAAPRRAFLAPAQPLPPAGDSPITELKITPQNLGLSMQRKLSRRERRKLRRKVGR